MCATPVPRFSSFCLLRSCVPPSPSETPDLSRFFLPFRKSHTKTFSAHLELDHAAAQPHVAMPVDNPKRSPPELLTRSVLLLGDHPPCMIASQRSLRAHASHCQTFFLFSSLGTLDGRNSPHTSISSPIFLNAPIPCETHSPSLHMHFNAQMLTTIYDSQCYNRQTKFWGVQLR